MDYNTYYLNQASNSFPVFAGYRVQKGYGLGGIFRKIYKWIVPIFKKHAVPVAKTFGHEVLKSTTNVVKDAINGKSIRESAKRRLDETLEELSNKAGIMHGEGIGSSINTPVKKFKKLQNSNKKKLKQILSSKFKQKRVVDIFDNV